MAFSIALLSKFRSPFGVLTTGYFSRLDANDTFGLIIANDPNKAEFWINFLLCMTNDPEKKGAVSRAFF